MTLRVGKELYKKLNIIFISIFIINKYNPSLSAINFTVNVLLSESVFYFCSQYRKRFEFESESKNGRRL